MEGEGREVGLLGAKQIQAGPGERLLGPEKRGGLLNMMPPFSAVPPDGRPVPLRGA